ncbi:hypothetical protein NLJ89_g7540 [Agrocybe chaxingu]|uniref:F-box domain-containing protein n=1 Tax=Agrocybe chaxingu TaxID=84603 RepID=A0A9W8JX57_9AGAR|nr:hypothetical protein NLJ89_g7540 [Agrocybe chaxingu]
MEDNVIDVHGVSSSIRAEEDSPIQRIPAEILQEIFLDAHYTPYSPNIRAGEVDFKVPWTIAQVCATWRDFSLCMPELWRRLPKIIVDVPSHPANIKVEALETRLARSGTLPIIFSLQVKTPPNYRGGPPHNRLIDMIVNHAEKWQEVTIAGDIRTALLALSQAKGRVPLLKTLAIVNSSDIYISNQVIFDVFEDAPLLCHATFEGRFFGRVLLPSRQLVSLKCTCAVMSASTQQILTAASLLQHLEITGTMTSYGLAMPTTTLPVLTVLKILNGSPTCLERLTAPDLKVLDIQTQSHDRSPLLPSLINFIERHSCLISLRLCIPTVEPGTLSHLLQLTPLLENLEVTLPPKQDIEALLYGIDNNPLVPSLKLCTFYLLSRAAIYTVDAISVPALNLLGATRCGQTRPLHINRLESLDVNLIQHPSFQLAPLLRLLEGWDISSTSAALYRLKTDLSRLIPGLLTGSRLEAAPQDDEELKRAFDALGNLEVTAPDLHVSSIHSILKYLSTADEFAYSKRARAILEKWRPSLEDNISDRHWMIQGSSAVYIPIDDARRSCAGFRDEMIFVKDIR